MFIRFHDQPAIDMTTTRTNPLNMTVSKLRKSSLKFLNASQSETVTKAMIGMMTRGKSFLTRSKSELPKSDQPDKITELSLNRPDKCATNVLVFNSSFALM